MVGLGVPGLPRQQLLVGHAQLLSRAALVSAVVFLYDRDAARRGTLSLLTLLAAVLQLTVAPNTDPSDNAWEAFALVALAAVSVLNAMGAGDAALASVVLGAGALVTVRMGVVKARAKRSKAEEPPAAQMAAMPAPGSLPADVSRGGADSRSPLSEDGGAAAAAGSAATYQIMSSSSTLPGDTLSAAATPKHRVGEGASDSAEAGANGAGGASACTGSMRALLTVRMIDRAGGTEARSPELRDLERLYEQPGACTLACAHTKAAAVQAVTPCDGLFTSVQTLHSSSVPLPT